MADTSAEFAVAGLHLTLLQQPANADLNRPATLRVALRDARNRIVTDRPDTVQLSLNNVTGPSGAELGAQTSAVLAHGLATLAPSLNHAGTYTITAADLTLSATGGAMATPTLVPAEDVAAITTRTFRVYGLHVAVVRQPATTAPAAPIAVRFALEDRHNHVITDAADTLALTLNVVDGTAGQSLDGQTSTAFANGIAAPSPVVDSAGVFTLTATDVVVGGGNPSGGGVGSMPNPDATAVTTRRFTIRA